MKRKVKIDQNLIALEVLLTFVFIE